MHICQLFGESFFGSYDELYSMVQNEMAAARGNIAIVESTMRIEYSKVQKCAFFHKSFVLKRLLVSPGSRSFLSLPLGLPLRMLTVITLEPINSCPMALPSPKGFGWGHPGPSPTSACSVIVTNALNSKPNLAAAI